MTRQQLPSQGIGPLVHNRYWVDIDGSSHRAAALRDVFRRNLAAVMPLEQAGPVTHLKKNQTFTVMLPLGAALPMRVEDITSGRIVCATLEGHPLAGLLSFEFIERGKQVRFEVGVHARAADNAGALLMAPLDGLLQALNWTAVVERMVKVSGGRAPSGVQSAATALDGEEAGKIEAWAAALAVRRLRGRVPPGPPIDGRRRAVRPRSPAARPRRRRPAAATGRARRKRTNSGSARAKGRSARPASARKATKRPRRSPAAAKRRGS